MPTLVKGGENPQVQQEPIARDGVRVISCRAGTTSNS